MATATGSTNFGATYDHISQLGGATVSGAIPSIRGFAIEPNLFGIATGATLCIFVAKYFTFDRRKTVRMGIALLSVALLLSYTRSAFIGLVMAVLAMAITSNKWRAIFSTIQVALLAVVALIAVLFFLPNDNAFKQTVSYKFGSGIVDFSEGTSIPRMVAFEESLKGFSKNPFIGNGIFSANNVFINPHTGEVTGTAGPIGWLNGLFIQALHDTGLIGVILWLTFFCLLLIRNFNTYKRLPPSLEKSIVRGFLGGNIVIFIGSQASSVVWISFPYIFWGLNLVLLRNFSNTLT
ncbi:MAG: O-antigen ligase family protein, partial [Flammeovirgaceae bacterium]